MITSRLPRALAVAAGVALAVPAAGAQQVEGLVLEPYDDGFGAVIAAIGDVDGDGLSELAVGAPDANGGAGGFTVLDGATLQARFTIDGGVTNGALGHVVAAAGDVNGDGVPDVAVGEPNLFATSPGSVRVYSGAWGFPLLTLGDGVTGDYYGHAVAGLGDVDGDGSGDLAVGIPEALGVSPSKAGRVRVVSGDTGAEFWSVTGSLANDRLGGSLEAVGDVDGDGVGDLLAGTRPTFFLTSPYVVLLSGATGAELARFDTSDPADETGLRLAGPGDLDHDGVPDLAVAAPRDDTVGNHAGAVRLYAGGDGSLIDALFGDPGAAHLDGDLSAAGDLDGDGWPDLALGVLSTFPSSGGLVRAVSGRTRADLFRLPADATSADLGTALAPAGDRDGDGFDELFASVLDSPQGVFRGVMRIGPRDPRAPLLVLEGAGYDRFGSDVASGEDYDGDGVDDWLVGANRVVAPGGGPIVGEISLLSGVDGALIRSQLGSAAAGVLQLGTVVEVLSDVTGDLVPDLVVGLPSHGAPSGAGRVLVLSGADFALVHDVLGQVVGGDFGHEVARGGDLDGDGVEDVLVGAPYDDTVDEYAGRAFVISGATGDVLLTVQPGSTEFAYFGTALAAVGDVNGDGDVEFVVGGPGGGTGALGGGGAWVFDGGGTLRHEWEGTAIYDRLGSSVAGPGDLDLDGFADVVVGAEGAPKNTISENLDGTLRAFSGLTGATLWSSPGLPWEELFGQTLTCVGDLDGDGVADLAAGAWDTDSYGYFNGYLATLSGATGERLQTVPGPQGTVDREDFGFALAGAGDLDGDGYADVLVSAPDADAGGVFNAGRVSVYSGRAPSWRGRGLALAGEWGTPSLAIDGDLDPGALTQWRLGGARPLATAWFVLGASELLAPFKAGVLLPSPDLLVPLPTDADGAVAFPLAWPALPAGLELHVQAWVADPAAPVGFSASNGATGLTY